MALNFVGFMTDQELSDSQMQPSSGNQTDDIANSTGAWSSPFRAAVVRFQNVVGLTVDSWIGPATRGALVTAVNTRNASGPNALPPPKLDPLEPLVVPVDPGAVPVAPNAAPLPGIVNGLSTATKVAIGAGVVGLLGLAWYVLK
jgi:hypothetical protein